MGGCCRVGVQIWTHQHRLLGACGMLRVTLTLLGAGHPPLSKSPPFQGLQSLIFPGEPADVGAEGTHIWGPSIASSLWGWINSLPRAPGQSWLGQGGGVCPNFGCFWFRRDGAGDRGHGGKANSRFNPGDGVFSLRSALPAQNSRSVEASRYFIKSLIKPPRRELIAFHSSDGSDGKQLLGR